MTAVGGPSGTILDGRETGVEAVVQVVIMLAIGCAAGAASFTHVHAVAAVHGQGGWLAWADAVVLELMSIASGLELRRRRHHGYPVTFPAVVLICAVVLSLAAQVVQAEPSVIGWIAAALPALGFLTMVKIALGHTGAHAAAADGRYRHGIVPVAGHGPEGGAQVPSGAVSAGAGGGRLVGFPARQNRDVTALDWDATAPDGGSAADDPDGPGRPRCDPAGTDTAIGVPERVSELLPAARAARARLLASGRRVSRDALAGQLRADGHPAANALVSSVHQALSADPATQGADDVGPPDAPTGARPLTEDEPDEARAPRVVRVGARSGS
jgi:Protein of unknown function (DUF2637)